MCENHGENHEILSLALDDYLDDTFSSVEGMTKMYPSTFSAHTQFLFN